ncbi:energy-coupling factor transporter transmembrane component T family protein [Nocardioides alcanivorans]|uniref:energy-coupling factor transporter transmembrane component T family protein n=1 Tax=Nocardioides alcanivorans TaxID=2897352 RepID=UPI001F4386C0|nr:energy-coupling factor transporter transmembrane component T [Nocardioides alcanivorans]
MSGGSARVRLARELHPGAWWVWAIGLAAAATFTTNPFLIGLLVVVITVVVLACRGDGMWARAFKFYLILGLVIVITRVFFRVVLGSGAGGHVWLDLPEIPLPDWAAGISLLGPITREAVLAGLYDGMRLGAIVVAVGAANALANPKRLMKSLPPALYEIGTALVVAVTVLPQLADSAVRVKHAQELRGGPPGRIRGLRRLIVPVLEDAFERSLSLAAGMDSRGYGRPGEAPAGQRRLTGAVMLLGLMGVCIGVYGFLDGTTSLWLGTPMMFAGIALALIGFVLAGRRVQRTRYRPDRWQSAEVAVALSGVAAGVVLWWVNTEQWAVAMPAVSEVPPVSAAALIGVLLGVVPLFVAPPPVTSQARDEEMVES